MKFLARELKISQEAATTPVVNGEAVALKLLRREQIIRPLETLGLTADALENMRDLMRGSGVACLTSDGLQKVCESVTTLAEVESRACLDAGQWTDLDGPVSRGMRLVLPYVRSTVATCPAGSRSH